VQPLDKLYKPKNNRVPCASSLCQAIQNNNCDIPTEQCDYEVEYADLGSSLGVLLSDYFPLRLNNGSLLQPRIAFGWVSCIPSQLTHPLTFFSVLDESTTKLNRNCTFILVATVKSGGIYQFIWFWKISSMDHHLEIRCNHAGVDTIKNILAHTHRLTQLAFLALAEGKQAFCRSYEPWVSRKMWLATVSVG